MGTVRSTREGTNRIQRIQRGEGRFNWRGGRKAISKESRGEKNNTKNVRKCQRNYSYLILHIISIVLIKLCHLSWQWFPKSHSLSNKNPITRYEYENPLSICWSGESKRLLKQYRPLLLPLVASQKLIMNLYHWRRNDSDAWHGRLEINVTWNPPPWNLLFHYFLLHDLLVLPLFHNTKRYSTSFQWREGPINSLVQCVLGTTAMSEW